MDAEAEFVPEPYMDDEPWPEGTYEALLNDFRRFEFDVQRYAAQLEDRAERANVHTAGLLVEIARELRKIAGAE